MLAAQVAAAKMVGLSDPARSNFKKFGVSEDDVGLLWFEPSALRYLGDGEAFTIRPEELLGVERHADAANMTSYAGARQIILTFRMIGGGERRVRLHNLGVWTLDGKKRAADILAAKLGAWQAQKTSDPIKARPDRGTV